MQALKFFAPVLGIVLFAAPAFAQTTTSIEALLAQIKALQEQVASMETTTSSQADDYGTNARGACPKLTLTMERGARDASANGEVSELQKFLADHYDLDPLELVTGYFGRITQGYVQRFQKEQGLPSFGIAGSMTRATIAKICGGSGMSSTKGTTSTTQAIATPAEQTPTITALPVGCTSSTGYSPVTGEKCGASVTATTKQQPATFQGIGEQVKCVFSGVTTEQRCYVATDSMSPYYGFGCFGTGACVVDLKGSKGDSVPWKSSCGGYAYTTMDGNNEYANFSCSTTPATVLGVSEQVKCVFSGASGEQKCWGDAPAQTVGSPAERYVCAGVGSCVVTVGSKQGVPMTWGSSCGGSANTTIDGNNEYANFSCATTTQPELPAISITVINPNGGGYWHKGESALVEWKTLNVPSDSQMLIRLRVYGSNAGQTEYNLVTSTNDGYEKLIVPTSVPTGAYTLEIKTAVGGQSYIDASDSYFKVVDTTSASSVTVIAPNGGEAFKIGEKTTIKWASVGVDKTYINWLQDRDGNGSYETVYGLFGSVPQVATGALEWTIPSQIFSVSSINTRNKISVNTSVPGVEDQSDVAFNIVSADSTTPVALGKNYMSCANSSKAGLTSGALACYGIWDFGGAFGEDQNMCPSGYGTPATGCKVTTSACASGQAIATRVLDTYAPWNADKSILASAADLQQIATNLQTSVDVVQKELIRVWEYSCTSPIESSVPLDTTAVMDDSQELNNLASVLVAIQQIIDSLTGTR